MWIDILHLMSKPGILVPSLHELPPDLMKLESNKEHSIKSTKCLEHTQYSTIMKPSTAPSDDVASEPLDEGREHALAVAAIK